MGFDIPPGDESRAVLRGAGQSDDISQFGYKQELHRTMGRYTSFALAFSMITVITTVFTLFSQPFQTVGGAAIWLWIPTTAGIALITMVYGHLAVRLPVTGYAYQWSSRIVSRRFGWFTGWNAMLATWVGSAGIATALATVFAPNFWDNPTHANVITLASIAIVAAVIINMVSITLASRINNVGASTELIGAIGIVVLVGLGLFFFQRHQDVDILFDVGTTTGDPVTLATFGHRPATAGVHLGRLGGFRGPGTRRSEGCRGNGAKGDAARHADLWSCRLLMSRFSRSRSQEMFRDGEQHAANPVVHIFGAHFGDFAADILQVVAFISMFSALIANVAVAIGRLSRWPATTCCRSPVASPRCTGGRISLLTIVMVGVFAIGVNLMSSGIVTNVTSVVAVVLYLTYGSTLVAVLVGLRRNTIPAAPARYFDLGRWLKPLCVIGLVWSVVVVAYMVLPESNHKVLLYAFGFQAAGLLWYLTVLRRRLAAGRAGAPISPLPPTPTVGAVGAEADRE